jgi:hypothetical protein
LIIPLLFACFPKKSEIPMIEAPAGPFVQALEQRARSFSSLRAFAEMQTVRKDKKRSFESVAVLVKGQERFRIEAYGPLGQSMATVLWNGKELVIDLAGERRVLPPNSFVLERVLGADLDPAELCAILSGNIPGVIAAYQPGLFCAPDGSCVLELRRDEMLVRVRQAAGRESGPFVLSSWEMFRNGKFVYRVNYDFSPEGAGYSVPSGIRVENPERRMSLSMKYTESEVNVPIDDQLFRSLDSEGLER